MLQQHMNRHTCCNANTKPSHQALMAFNKVLQQSFMHLHIRPQNMPDTILQKTNQVIKQSWRSCSKSSMQQISYSTNIIQQQQRQCNLTHCRSSSEYHNSRTIHKLIRSAQQQLTRTQHCKTHHYACTTTNRISMHTRSKQNKLYRTQYNHQPKQFKANVTNKFNSSKTTLSWTHPELTTSFT